MRELLKGTSEETRSVPIQPEPTLTESEGEEKDENSYVEVSNGSFDNSTHSISIRPAGRDGCIKAVDVYAQTRRVQVVCAPGNWSASSYRS